MSIVYYPINGYAGSIDFILSQYEDSVFVDSETITLKIAGFQENNEESSFNEVFENINDELLKEYSGYRKSLSFTLINSPFSDNHVIGSSNLGNIIKLMSWINMINKYPINYKLTIDYRSGGALSRINNAVMVGDVSLSEISEKANAGQTIQLEFKDRNISDLGFYVSIYVTKLTAEDSLDKILTTENGKILIIEQFI